MRYYCIFNWRVELNSILNSNQCHATVLDLCTCIFSDKRSERMKRYCFEYSEERAGMDENTLHVIINIIIDSLGMYNFAI